MYQCILKFCVVSLCLINKFFITSQAPAQDWSMLLRKPYDQDPIEERGYLQAKESQARDDDDDANNPCPVARSGEIAKQPWDINAVHGIPKPWLDSNPPAYQNDNNNDRYSEHYQEQESSDSNCKDDGSDVVIKILFNRDEPCDKKKATVSFDRNSRYRIFSKPGVNVNISNTHNNMWKK